MNRVWVELIAKAAAFGALIISGIFFQAHPSLAQYRIDAGDIIEIVIDGTVDVRKRETVQIDGTIALPSLGSVAVAGLTPAELRTTIQGAIISRPYRRRSPDGTESIVLIGPSEITANIVEYRPVYVNGDVAKTGELTYRPLMTVRQAITLAGGFDGAHARVNPLFDATDLQSEFEALSLELVKEQIRMSRLQAELDNNPKLEMDAQIERRFPQARIAFAEILKSEQELLGVRRNDVQREKDFLRQAIAKANGHIESLHQQLDREHQANVFENQDFDKLNGLLKRGSTSNARVAEARRAVLQGSTRRLEINAQLAQTLNARDDHQRRLEQYDDQRRLVVLQELEDTSARARARQTSLKGIEQKQLFVAGGRNVGGISSTIGVSIVRKTTEGRKRFDASEDSELWPGDVVTLSLRSELAQATPVR